ncbi:D-alanine--D-alanine ligase [Campylobacter sp. MIT 97-5078]|uniref:D-alanine--D-alanine ligase n=1 Tax=Campylobacter sp. MIT 97-5078 TaxID=1548153 RepID=UPI000512BCA7|nr:D-alanine--D-alanine ligase [Campylobacter sp. MIT 97-5078]KGI55604.1 D-alanine--D-alanine ligase [Campylobacter sp. MIT 97-5078]KGI57268.1 D-alanine--D-alanine ligase [Campylobacter sp. MIT 97-5078]TQR23568.1 D-alanine--D-alanine ligase [Campylobacter sp. MIT 97-5078]
MKYAVIFGANSYEHEISIVSAVVLKKVFRADMSFVYCDSLKHFYLIPEDKMNAKTFSSKAYLKEKELFLKQGGFFEKGLFGEKKLECEIYINLVHGKDGEDGKFASLFEFFNLAYIGPRIEASVLSYNKELTKLYAQKVGVKVLPYKLLKSYDKTSLAQDFDFPCIIKPARLGSSIGISVVKDKSELEYAKDVGFEFDGELLIEPFIKDIKEYNLAGCMINDDFIFSMIEEPQKKELLDFEQKYLSFSGNNEVKEAKLDEALKAKFYEAFKKIYNPLFKGALIRCDFFVIDDEVYINEINPNPGSLANYLFDDFSVALERLAKNVKNEKKVKTDFAFLHSINASKGKL